jgi:hypothetical protein
MNRLDRPTARLRLAATVVAILLLVGALPFSADAHPGALDVDGCHTICPDRDYLDPHSGETLKSGSRHCHRGLELGMKLDGSERLRAPGEAEAPAAPCDNSEPPGSDETGRRQGPDR